MTAMRLLVALLIAGYAVAASVGFLIATNHTVACMGLYPEQNAACQAAAVARLPFLLGTPVPWVVAFVVASSITVLLARSGPRSPGFRKLALLIFFWTVATWLALAFDGTPMMTCFNGDTAECGRARTALMFEGLFNSPYPYVWAVLVVISIVAVVAREGRRR